MTATAPPPVAETPFTEGGPATRWQRVRGPALVIGGLGIATLALRLRDPHEHGSWGLCPSAALGVYCPGCGGLRAVNDLTHGDLAGAASSNLAFVVALPFIVIGLALWAIGRWRGRPVRLSMSVITPTAHVSLALLTVFTVLRNLPAGSWLAP
ncbi:DUF2752 domain-containing protein [Nocardioides endophyticus]|uniref:DUF2752 domain-containing protein n=1 Tax=Nocardioides endophyticus TaxID=1353775 RepID=A0ABP8ZKY4_9ACTN